LDVGARKDPFAELPPLVVRSGAGRIAQIESVGLFLALGEFPKLGVQALDVLDPLVLDDVNANIEFVSSHWIKPPFIKMIWSASRPLNDVRSKTLTPD
jgi:hypothetical protein